MRRGGGSDGGQPASIALKIGSDDGEVGATDVAFDMSASPIEPLANGEHRG